MTIRHAVEDRERKTLTPRARLSAESLGRLRPEPGCDIRPDFQQDRDRILHSKSFRRLKHKTQVFLAPKGDHYRTRLTHTLEVSQIARTVTRALALNEDLAEAIALGHDLGHTPFGHAGEAVLNRTVPGGFQHAPQSLRVVDFLERDGLGLNLTHEVREGILKHSKGKGPVITSDRTVIASTLEGQIVRLSDLMAYVNHDVDDAVRAGIIREEELPPGCLGVLGSSSSSRIDAMVRDMVFSNLDSDSDLITLSPEMVGAMEELRDFLFRRVYEADSVRRDFEKASKILIELFQYFMEDQEALLRESDWKLDSEDVSRSICDFLAGMTDGFAMALYERIFLPRSWPVY